LGRAIQGAENLVRKAAELDKINVGFYWFMLAEANIMNFQMKC